MTRIAATSGTSKPGRESRYNCHHRFRRTDKTHFVTLTPLPRLLLQRFEVYRREIATYNGYVPCASGVCDGRLRTRRPRR